MLFHISENLLIRPAWPEDFLPSPDSKPDSTRLVVLKRGHGSAKILATAALSMNDENNLFEYRLVSNEFPSCYIPELECALKKIGSSLSKLARHKTARYQGKIHIAATTGEKPSLLVA